MPEHQSRGSFDVRSSSLPRWTPLQAPLTRSVSQYHRPAKEERGSKKKITKREMGLETFGVRKEVLEQVSKAAPKAVGAEKPHDYHCHVCHDEDLSGPTHLLV